MACILYARERSPGILLDPIPTKERGREKEREKKKSSQDPKETKLTQDTTLAKESIQNHRFDLPVCRTTICMAGLVFCIPSKAHCLKT